MLFKKEQLRLLLSLLILSAHRNSGIFCEWDDVATWLKVGVDRMVLNNFLRAEIVLCLHPPSHQLSLVTGVRHL